MKNYIKDNNADSVNNAYLEMGELNVVKLGQEFTWLDAGAEESLLESAIAVKNIQKKTRKMVGCIEEIAYRKDWIDKEQLKDLANDLIKTKYGNYLYHIAVTKKKK